MRVMWLTALNWLENTGARRAKSGPEAVAERYLIRCASKQSHSRVYHSTMPHTIVDLTESSPIAPVKPASMPLDTVLIDAINDAQPSRLAIALQLICRNSVDASRIAQEILLVPEEKAVRKIVDRKNRTESENESEDESEDGSEEDDSATDNSEDGSEDEESDHSEAQGQANHHPPNALKRLRSRYTTCENCSEEFDVTMNGKYDCVWHPGIIFINVPKN